MANDVVPRLQFRSKARFRLDSTALIPVVGVFTLVPNAGSLTTFELRVTGLPANSVVTVLSDSTLSGSGTVGGLVANSGSTIAP